MASSKFSLARSGQAQFASLDCILSSLKETCAHVTAPEGHNVHAFKHPRASLLGLPTEIRLQIYACLADCLHFHVDVPVTQRYTTRYSFRSIRNRKLRLCNAPDASFRQLCTRPAFSGLDPTARLCQSQPASSGNPFALRATCRAIHKETRGFLEKNRLGVTVEAGFASVIWNNLKLPAIQSLTRLTILHAPQLLGYTDMHYAVAWLRASKDLLSSLRTLAVQTPLPHYKFCIKRPGTRLLPQFAPAQTWHKVWFVKALHEAFAGRVTIILEAWVVVRAGYRENQSAMDEMVVMRGVAWGNRQIERKGDVSFEILKRQKVLEVEEKAQWKSWWMHHVLGFGRKPS